MERKAASKTLARREIAERMSRISKLRWARLAPKERSRLMSEAGKKGGRPHGETLLLRREHDEAGDVAGIRLLPEGGRSYREAEVNRQPPRGNRGIRAPVPKLSGRN